MERWGALLAELKKSFLEVLMAILPTAAIIVLLEIFAAGADAETIAGFLTGTALVIVGMTLFLPGANLSMMEVGRRIGSFIVQKRKLSLLLAFGFILGFAATIAEPDVKVLAVNVFELSEGGIGKLLLMVFVAVGVGLFIVVALLRILWQKSIVLTLLIGYGIAFALALFTPQTFFPAAFDSGGVTTGPITVPFILAFAAGVTGVMSRKKDGDDTFGMVGLASLGPIISVLILGMLFR